MLTVLSVIIVAAEILLGLAVCWRRTRRLGGVGCVVLLLGIELFARELTFGGLMLALLFHAFGSRASAAASYALTATFVVGGCIALASFSLV